MIIGRTKSLNGEHILVIASKIMFALIVLLGRYDKDTDI
jgi:hypothetical protein